MFDTPHFETGNYKAHPVFLPDDEYGRALDCLVKACSDMLIQNEEGKLLIGKRNVEPQPDWWYGCGGRMKPGETPSQSACRLLRRELGVDLGESGSSRFETVGHYSYVWEKRQQEPADHGTADISCVLTVRLTPEEVAGMTLDRKEYDENKWVDPAQLVSDSSYHPALRKAVSDFLASLTWKQLRSAVTDGDEQAVAKIAKQLVQGSDRQFE